MPMLERARRVPVMCLTQDGHAVGHVEQAERLCAAGARWIQLRAKGVAGAEWRALAREIVGICRAHGAVSIVNDSVEVALETGADGVHLGSLDLDWRQARRRLGPGRLLGGTVNTAADAERARSAGCLDYAGVGPYRFTSSKQVLAPVLGLEGVAGLVAALAPLPVWAIGGIEAQDLPGLRAKGAAGVAVSAALFARGAIEDNFRALDEAWARAAAADRPSHAPSHSL